MTGSQKPAVPEPTSLQSLALLGESCCGSKQSIPKEVVAVNQQGFLPFLTGSVHTSPPGTTVASVSWKLSVQVEVSSLLLAFLASPSH